MVLITATTAKWAAMNAKQPSAKQQHCAHCHANDAINTTESTDADNTSPSAATPDTTAADSQTQAAQTPQASHAGNREYGYIQDQQKLIARLSRIEGQIRGIKQMAKDGEYCINILTQISAADKALKSVALLLLEDHLTHCIKEASLEGGEVAGEKIEEASKAIARLVRS